MRLYGTVTLNGRQWIIETEPQVALRIKRVFQKIKKNQYGKLTLSATPENTRELEWFLKRYPMTMEAPDKERLDELTYEHQQTELLVGQILGGSYEAPVFELAVQPRDYQRISADLAMKTGRLLIADDVGLGKAQPLTSRVLTPSGWKKMGDLRLGDNVIDPDGGTGEVTEIYPQGERDIFRVFAKDGGYAECCEEHLWGIYSANDRKRNGAMRVLELRQFVDDLKRSHSKPEWSISKWFLPLPKPVQFSCAEELPIHPYLLGALLGDGTLCTGAIRITSVDDGILSRVRECLPPEMFLSREGSGQSWRLVINKLPGTNPPNPLKDALRWLELLGSHSYDKHIPEEYLRAPVEIRVDLLRGLMDTDGDCTKDGVSILSTSSQILRDQVIDLVRSLGGIASSYTKQSPTYEYLNETRTGRPAHRVNIRLPFNPFYLQRKRERWKLPIMARAIDRVDPAGRTQVQCIRVSTKRHLYITDGHLVTHNTAQAICTFTDPSNLPALVVTLAHLPKQWQREVEKFAPKLRTHVIKKGTPYDICKGKKGEKVLFPDVIIINYHKLTGWAETLAGVVKTVVYDEVQELRRSESLKYSGAIHISEQANLKLGLSATPIYNYGGEIYSVVSAIDPGCLGEKDEFMREWCDSYMADRPKIRDPKAFGSYLREQGIMIRRTRTEVGRELEPLTKIPQAIEADTEALSSIEDSAAELAKIILSQNSLKKGIKMQAAEELSNLVRQATGIAKAPYVADFVRMLAEAEEPVLLYCWHREVYSILNAKLADLGPVMYTGSESGNQKALSVQRFLDGESKILMMSLRAGAGLDGLQKVCRTVVFGELDWSPGVHDQCIGRIHRDGQTDPVMAYFLLSDYGSDPVMSDVLGVKRSQMIGIRDPNADLIEAGQASDHDVKKLAESFLRQRGLEIQEPSNLSNLIQLRPKSNEQQETIE